MTSATEGEELRVLDYYLRSHFPLWAYLLTMFYILFSTQNMMVITTRPGKRPPTHSKNPYGSMIAINTTVVLHCYSFDFNVVSLRFEMNSDKLTNFKRLS